VLSSGAARGNLRFLAFSGLGEKARQRQKPSKPETAVEILPQIEGGLPPSRWDNLNGESINKFWSRSVERHLISESTPTKKGWQRLVLNKEESFA